MERLDKFAVGHFLSYIARFENRELSQGAIDFISTVLQYEMQTSWSMATVVNKYMEFSGCYTQIKDGMDRLPKSFVNGADPPGNSRDNIFPDLAADVRYNLRVTEVSISYPGLSVEYVNTMTGYKNSEYFDRIIVSIPFAALRHIRMYGLTSPQKRRAIRQLHYVNACKILLEFDKKFWLECWPDRPAISGGRLMPLLPVRSTFGR
jgi:monoamine oxidase